MATADTMFAGAGEVVISPPVGAERPGYFQPRVSEGVISDLMAKAIVAGRECDLYAGPRSDGRGRELPSLPGAVASPGVGVAAAIAADPAAVPCSRQLDSRTNVRYTL